MDNIILKDQTADLSPAGVTSGANLPHFPKCNNKRDVICGDSIEYLKNMPEKTFPSGYCGFTSLPDISELQDMFPGPGDVEEYKEWFTNTAELFMSKLPEGSFVIFLQSDVRIIKQNTNEVLQWIDKSHLCSLAADRSGCTMMWHKLVSSCKLNYMNIYFTLLL